MILRSTNVRSALRARQRGFLLNPFRFGNAVPLALDPYLTNLWGAYGLTQLRVGYGGSAIRVRRSSDNAERDIGFAANVLDTSDLATWGGSDSVFVTTWYDQTANGRDFVQATSAKQPRVVNAGTYDGFIRFDGSDDDMSLAGSPAVAAISGAMKYQFRSSGASHALWSQNNNNTAAHITFNIQEQTGGVDAMYMYQFGSVNPNYLENRFATLPTALGTDLWVMDRSLSGAARGARYRNGANEAATSLVNSGSGNFTSETFYIGSDAGTGTFANMNLYTFAIWTSNQAANAAGIHTAIN